jgi:hypothetical protein
VDRFKARVIIRNKLSDVEIRVQYVQDNVEETSDRLAVLGSRLRETPDLRPVIEKLEHESRTFQQELNVASAVLEELRGTLASANIAFEKLMCTIYDTSDVFTDAADGTDHVKDVFLDDGFRITLKLSSLGLQEIRKIEENCGNAARLWQEAQRLARRANAAASRSRLRRQIADPTIQSAVRYCESVSAILWKRWRATQNALALRKFSQRARESKFLEEFAFDQLVACGRLKVARGYGFAEQSSDLSVDIDHHTATSSIPGTPPVPVDTPEAAQEVLPTSRNSTPSEGLESFIEPDIPDEVQDWYDHRKWVYILRGRQSRHRK